ncbi:hypothetical protein CDAR_35611, partial [Caerostris darwini]
STRGVCGPVDRTVPNCDVTKIKCSVSPEKWNVIVHTQAESRATDFNNTKVPVDRIAADEWGRRGGGLCSIGKSTSVDMSRQNDKLPREAGVICLTVNKALSRVTRRPSFPEKSGAPDAVSGEELIRNFSLPPEILFAVSVEKLRKLSLARFYVKREPDPISPRRDDKVKI